MIKKTQSTYNEMHYSSYSVTQMQMGETGSFGTLK